MPMPPVSPKVFTDTRNDRRWRWRQAKIRTGWSRVIAKRNFRNGGRRPAGRRGQTAGLLPPFRKFLLATFIELRRDGAVETNRGVRPLRGRPLDGAAVGYIGRDGDPT